MPRTACTVPSVPQNRAERRHGAAKVVEKVTPTIAAQDSTGDKYRMRVISAGKGSSGYYPADMLERDVAAAFPAGTRMRGNHDGWFSDGGDVFRLMAKTVGAAEWDDQEQAAFADFQVGSAYTEWFRDFADVIGVSIQASAEAEWPELDDDMDVELDGPVLPTITRLLPASEAPYNSIDFVEAPGANGRIVAALESLRDIAHEKFGISETSKLDAVIADRRGTPASPPSTKEGIQMDEEQLKAVLAEHAESVLARVAEAVKPVVEPPTEKPTLKATTEAIVAAGLTEDGRDAVYEAIEGGKSLEDAITREKAREDKMRAEITATLEAKAAAESVQYGFVSEGGKAGGTLTEFEDVDSVLSAIEGAR